MRLVVFGCSNTYGHGLSDCLTEDGHPGLSPSKLSWPNQTAKELNLELVNLGQSGASNKRIWHNAYYYFDYKPDDIVIIQWSYITRYAILRKNHEHKEVERIKTDVNLHPSIDTKMNNFYFKRIFELYDAQQHLLLYTNHLHNFFDNRNIKCYHLYTDFDMYEASWYTHLPIKLKWKHWGFHRDKIDVADDNVHVGPNTHKQYGKKVRKWIEKN